MYLPLVNHELKFICFYNAKCGSTTIKRWFLNTVGVDTANVGDPDIHKIVGYTKGDKYYIAREEMNECGDYYKFILVRNPWRRLVSGYVDKTIHMKGKYINFVNTETEARIDNLSFRNFILAINETPERLLETHVRHQMSGMQDIAFDYVVKLESLEVGMRYICSQLGIRYKSLGNFHAMCYRRFYIKKVCDLLPGRFDERSLPPYGAFYDAPLRRIVEIKFRRDIKRFSYGFGD